MNTQKVTGFFTVLSVMFFVMMGGNVYSQAPWSQSTACPGWNNPNNFVAASTDFAYRGYFGTKPNTSSIQYNVMTGTTGIQWNSSIISGNQLLNAGLTGCPSKGISPLPDHDKSFAIMTSTSQSSGHPVNKDPNTADHLSFVPTQFNTNDTTGYINTNLTRSIRIGDDCASSSDYDGTALDYEMYVTSSNALMYIYYAVVVQSPTHGKWCDPVFIVRVMKQNASGIWQQVGDTMAYYISSTPESGQGIAVGSTNGGYGDVVLENDYGTNGWHANNTPNGATANSSSILFKDWTKVALNLSNYLYERVRIEVIISDCCYSYHMGYAYVAGECRPMQISCMAGDSTLELNAPVEMMNYDWAVSEYGVAEPFVSLMPGQNNSYFTFRPVSDSADRHYEVKRSDFHVDFRPHAPGGQDSVAVDSMGNSQTFRCTMTTALDPDKPYTSDLYINVYRNCYPFWGTTSDSLCGSVTGSGFYCGMDTVVFVAIANEGYFFDRWSDGNRDNPRRVVVPLNLDYNDSSLTNYVALFAPRPYVSLSTPDTAKGNVYGGGYCDVGDTVTISAVANDGYAFDSWNDGNADNPRSVVVTCDTTFTAYFIQTVGIEIVDETERVKIFSDGRRIVVDDVEGEEVTVYNAMGYMVWRKKKGDSGRYTLPKLSAGVYMVKVGDNSTSKVLVF